MNYRSVTFKHVTYLFKDLIKQMLLIIIFNRVSLRQGNARQHRIVQSFVFLCVYSLHTHSLSVQIKTTKSNLWNVFLSKTLWSSLFPLPCLCSGTRDIELLEIYFGFQSKYFSGRWVNSGSAHHVNCFSGTYDKVCFSNSLPRSWIVQGAKS